MTDTIGVSAEPMKDGAWFVGPGGKTAWSPNGELSSSLSFVVGWDVAQHPWDPWPPERRIVFPGRKRKRSRPQAPKAANV